MRFKVTTALALLAVASTPALAQSNAELLKELQALKDRVQELEKKLQASTTPAATVPAGQLR
jgi:hypothetical protein